MTDDPTSGVQFVPSSRWIAIFKETSFMVSSRHGHPIHRDPEHPKEKPFPWKGLGYLRWELPDSMRFASPVNMSGALQCSGRISALQTSP